jgi:hypothetical protein
VGNVPVIFTVLSDANVKGSGTLQGGVKSLSTVSNTSGIASVMYTLGTTSGLNRSALFAKSDPCLCDF